MYFSESDTSIIYRKQDFQIETTKGRDSRITSKIYWINENEYSLEIIEIENIELQYVEVGSVLHVVIDTCEQNYYDFTIYFNEYFVGPTRYYYDLEK